MANVPPVSNSTDSVGGTGGQPARRRRWPRIVLLCVCGLAALGTAIVWATFRLTSPAVDAAEAFLTATAEGGPAASYMLASPAFRAATPESAWESFARNRRLTAYQSASWTSRSIDANGTAELAGTMTFQDGDRMPVQISLVKSQEHWRVLAMRSPVSGAQSSETSAGSSGTVAPAQQSADLSSRAAGGAQQRAENALPPSQSATPSSVDTTMPASPGSGANASWETAENPPGGSPATPAAPSPSLGSSAQLPGVAVSSLSPPPENYAPPTPMVPAAKVAGTCMYLFSSRAHLALDGMNCATGLRAVPGATIRCVAQKNGQEAGVTVTLQSYNSSSSHPELSCVLDGA